MSDAVGMDLWGGGGINIFIIAWQLSQRFIIPPTSWLQAPASGYRSHRRWSSPRPISNVTAASSAASPSPGSVSGCSSSLCSLPTSTKRSPSRGCCSSWPASASTYPCVEASWTQRSAALFYFSVARQTWWFGGHLGFLSPDCKTNFRNGFSAPEIPWNVTRHSSPSRSTFKYLTKSS